VSKASGALIDRDRDRDSVTVTVIRLLDLKLIAAGGLRVMAAREPMMYTIINIVTVTVTVTVEY
jgi:hypothetical protein